MIEKFQVIILNMKEIKKYSNPFKMIYTKTLITSNILTCKSKDWFLYEMHTRLKCVEGLKKTEDNIFSVKTFKTTRGLGEWCIPNALNLENLE